MVHMPKLAMSTKKVIHLLSHVRQGCRWQLRGTFQTYMTASRMNWTVLCMRFGSAGLAGGGDGDGSWADIVGCETDGMGHTRIDDAAAVYS